jgi:midasin
MLFLIYQGYWVLLDEVNLASAETLESLSGLLEGGSICLTERGDITPVPRHPDFCLFGCMNPPNDVGKRDLPPGLRNRFTEFFVVCYFIVV